MKISLDESYHASTDNKTLGFVGETNSRTITIENYQCDGADSYKMRFKYPDGVVYDVDISDSIYTIDGSILRRVGDVYLQILACRSDGDTYEFVKKSNILTLHICSSLNGDPAPVPTYEESVDALEKVLLAEKSSAENVSKAEISSNAAQAAQNAAEQAKETAQTAADIATDKAAEISKSAEQIQKNTDDIAKLYSKSDGIVCSAKGTEITLNDSSDLGFSGMKIFGRSTQETTTGVQLLTQDQQECTFNFTAGANVNDTVHAGWLNINADFANGAFLSFVSDKTIPFKIVFVPKYRDNEGTPEWGNVTAFSVESGLNTVVIAPSMLDGENKDVGFQIRANSVPTEDITATFTNIFLKSGQEAAEYEPYTGGQPSPNPDYPQEIVSVGNSGGIDVCANGKNLLPDNSSTVRGVAASINNGVLKMTGTVDNTNTTSRVYWASSTLKNILIPGKTYYLSCDNPDIHFRFIISNTLQINDVAEYTVTGDERSISVWLILGDKPQAEGDKVDITARVSLSECEPQTINISTPNGLPGIPVDSGGNYTDENGQQWVCDEIDLGRGVYVQRIYEQIFNGTENWKINDTGTKYFMLSDTTPNVSKKSNQLIGLCDKTKIISYKDTDRGTGYGIAFIYYWRCNFAECDAISGATVDDLKLFLAENPMKIMYAGVPIETPLTAQQIAAYKSLHTNNPTTVISNSDNAHMAVDYTADTKTYIDNKFNELATAIIATGGDT